MQVIKKRTINDRCLFFPVVLIFILVLNGCKNPAADPDPELVQMSSVFSSLDINGTPYIHRISAPVQLVTGEVFEFKVVLENNGITTWGRNVSAGEHGASLLSRGDPSHNINDYNETFGAFFILYPMQFGIPWGSYNPTVLPGESWEIDTLLKTPDKPGRYTMRWQTAQWPLGTSPGIHHSNTTASSSTRNNPNNYFNRPFFGKEIVVDFVITQRSENPPVHDRKDGVLDEFDFEYQGSFLLPEVRNPETNGRYSRTYTRSGITLRKIKNEHGEIVETRMLAVAGTYANRTVLYEVIVPQSFGQIDGTSVSAVPVAELTTIFSGQSSLLLNEGGGSEGWSLGSMWLDENTDLLYWTNWADYPASQRLPALPSLFYAKIDFEHGVVSDRVAWRLPENMGTAPFGGFMGGVTVIPDSFADEYLDGRKLAIGFGGGGSISSIRSYGPALAAVSLGNDGTLNDDFVPFLYYPADAQNGLTHCIRDGNYLSLEYYYTNPTSPWEGKWIGGDTIRTGVFIDYKEKQGYVTFANQAIGRTAYDFAGRRFFAQRQSAWYFYDFETIGKAALGAISSIGLTPSSYHVVNYPTTWADPSRSTNIDTTMTVTGSCFDQDTGLLYLYVRFAHGDEPLVHVYKLM